MSQCLGPVVLGLTGAAANALAKKKFTLPQSVQKVTDQVSSTAGKVADVAGKVTEAE